jgi:uncharacterized protein (DUF1330 family)
MTGYLIANIDVRDLETFNNYREKVTPIAASFGGRFLVRCGEFQALEGDLDLKRLLIIEFPSLEASRRFYDSPEYAPVKRLRLESALSDIVLVEGHSPPA